MSSVLVALRRLRDDRAPAVGLAILVLVTAFVFGVTPRLVERVSDDALRGTLDRATALGRNIALIEEQGIPSDPADPLKNVEAEGDRLDARLPPAIRAIVADRNVVVDSARYRVGNVTKDPTTVRFRIQPGALERVRITAGRAPAAERRLVDLPDEYRRLLPPDEPPSRDPIKVLQLQAVVAPDALRQAGLAVGDTLYAGVDPTDPLGGRAAGAVAVVIAGAAEPIDPADPFWFDDQTTNRVTIRSGGGDARFLDIGALLPVDAYDLLTQASLGSGLPVRYTWRYFVDPNRVSASRLDGTILDLRRLETKYSQTQVVNGLEGGVAMRSGLLPTLLAHADRWASASAILTVVAIGPAAVAFAALGLVAMLTARRRRPAIALVRGRGATIGQIVRAVCLEGCVIAIPALAVAILLAVLLVPVGSTRTTIVAATLVAAIAVTLLVVSALPGMAAASRAGRDDDPLPRAVTARRLVLDGVVILAAVAGTYLLRERGVRGTSSTGTLAGADPLIAAVPALAGIAAGLTAIRLVPIPLRLLGRLAGRGRGLVPLLALRRAVHGGTTAAVLIVLLATSSIGVFSSAALVHLERAGLAASWQEVGAPFRATAAVGALPASLKADDLPGVTSAAGMYKAFVPVGPRNLRIQFTAVDLASWEEMLRGTPGDLMPPPEMLADLAPTATVPILVSPELAARSDGLRLGQPVEVVVEGYHYPVVPIATRVALPATPTDAIWVLASRQQLRAIHREAPLAPSSLLLAAPDGDGAAIRDAVQSVAAAATVDSRAVFARAFNESPVTAAIVGGIAVAALVAAIYAGLAVTAALALAGASRTSEVSHLRMIGLSRRDTLGLAVVEHGPTVLLAFLAGAALGLGLFVILQPGLGLDALVGSRLDVPLEADPRQLAGVFGAVFLIAALGIALAAWMQRRGIAVAALRRGFE